MHAGDWEPDPAKFPRGLGLLKGELKSRGISLGLWVGLTTVHESAAAFQEFGDCLVCDAEGKHRSTLVWSGPHAMACLGSRFADHIEAKLHELVRTLDLPYLKLDLPAPLDVYHKPTIHGHAPGHLHAPGCESTLHAYRAVQRIARRLKAAAPALVIDITFELCGGWHAIDRALLASADVCWLRNLGTTEAVRPTAPPRRATLRPLAAV